MPRYEVITNEPLRDSQQADLAREITDAHVKTTGAPPTFVHVVFATTGKGNTFVAGEQRNETAVRGFIRSGRHRQTVEDLLTLLSARVSRVTGEDESGIVVWLSEVDSSRIMEGGRVMPPPGEE